MKVGFASAAVSGDAAAALLLSDYAIVAPGASISIDSGEVWAGVVWRIGAGALRLHIQQNMSFTAEEALSNGLVDEIAPDPSRFLGSRSAMALDSAAMLVARRGGDALERAEFARLFAAGEPQRGLRAFLEKRPPQFAADANRPPGSSVAEKT